MDITLQLLKEKAKEFYIDLSDEQIEQFEIYKDFLEEYNQHTNLVSAGDLKNIVKKHFVDSLSIGLIKNQLGWEHKRRVLDIGIGGGFPGIPIMIANPRWKLCAVDSVGKKTDFLIELAAKLGIEDRVNVYNKRIEEFAFGNKEKFDLVVARALSDLPVLLEYSLPFLKGNGFLLAYKGKTVEEEIKNSKRALSILGGNIKEKIPYDLEYDDEKFERKLILINKIKKTPEQYPRKTGVPKKKPLV